MTEYYPQRYPRDDEDVPNLTEQQSRNKQTKKLSNPSTLSTLSVSNNSRTYVRAGTCYTVVCLRQCEQQFLQQQQQNTTISVVLHPFLLSVMSPERY